MTYQVKFTETTNPAKPPLTVNDQALNTETNLTFVGKNYAGYAPIIAENFLHLLENFARNIAPGEAVGDTGSPVQGQLWYDNSTGVNLLKVYDGTTWTAAGSVKKSTSAPLIANSTKGDLWIDTTNQQLYIFSGSSWLLVGPQYSAGLKTGPNVEVITDTSNVNHSVISLYSENNIIAIISKSAFTPKSVVSGFTTISQGINLSSTDASSTTAPTKFWGTASQADALVVGGATVNASNFLRTDQSSTSNYPINVRSNAGISLGGDLSFNIGKDGNSTVLYSKTSGNNVDIKLTNNSVATTVVHIDANTNVGIGPNNTSPQEALDVLGSITASEQLLITGTADSSALSTGSIITAGGLSVAKKSTFGKDITTYGKIYINNLDGAGSPTPATVLSPGSDLATDTYDIGSASRRFRNIYAQSFVGNFSGVFTGQLQGSISGTASALASPTAFKIRGDVTSTADVDFNGQTVDGTATFNTTISQDFITAKPVVVDSLSTDMLLVYRSGTNSGLKSISKQTFISNIATVPVGAIFPYAGLTAPAGYLLCDGSEVSVASYPLLFGVIAYTYKPQGQLIGLSTFGLPDYRGRFPLGADNMNNNRTVPSQANSNINISAGGGSANRVTSPTADVIGNYSGAEATTIAVANLPDHKHNMKSTNGVQYYAVGLPNTSDTSADPGYGMPASSTGPGLKNSGGVSSSTLGTPVTTMNPYQTTNYIIFTGVL